MSLNFVKSCNIDWGKCTLQWCDMGHFRKCFTKKHFQRPSWPTFPESIIRNQSKRRECFASWKVEIWLAKSSLFYIAKHSSPSQIVKVGVSFHESQGTFNWEKLLIKISWVPERGNSATSGLLTEVTSLRRALKVWRTVLLVFCNSDMKLQLSCHDERKGSFTLLER